MELNDTQLGKPTTFFKGTTAELSALSAAELNTINWLISEEFT